jgi:hypothetical protein
MPAKNTTPRPPRLGIGPTADGCLIGRTSDDKDIYLEKGEELDLYNALRIWTEGCEKLNTPKKDRENLLQRIYRRSRDTRQFPAAATLVRGRLFTPEVAEQILQSALADTRFKTA